MSKTSRKAPRKGFSVGRFSIITTTLVSLLMSVITTLNSNKILPKHTTYDLNNDGIFDYVCVEKDSSNPKNSNFYWIDGREVYQDERRTLRIRFPFVKKHTLLNNILEDESRLNYFKVSDYNKNGKLDVTVFHGNNFYWETQTYDTKIDYESNGGQK